MFLRPDVPCDSRCVDREFHQAENDRGLISRCFSCYPNGSVRDFSPATYWNRPYWPSKISRKTTSVLVGVGAWYNLYHQLLDPMQALNETFHIVGPLFEAIRANGTEIYWLDLPPMILPQKNSIDNHLQYAWRNFSAYNRLAKESLTPYGVVYMDTESILRPRKTLDPSLTADLLHWCIPGDSSVPMFILRLYFHLLSRHARHS
jgi:hypothetical protein